jgi:hypothetical protein
MAWIRGGEAHHSDAREARALRRLVGAAALTLAAMALGGCWPFGHHGPPPQQQYFDALKLGNAAQASQIWLSMTPEERLKFERGQDVRPSVSPRDVQHAVAEHYADQAEDDDNSAPKQVELAPEGGGLQDLPGYLKEYGGASGASPSAPAVAPAGPQ